MIDIERVKYSLRGADDLYFREFKFPKGHEFHVAPNRGIYTIKKQNNFINEYEFPEFKGRIHRYEFYVNSEGDLYWGNIILICEEFSIKETLTMVVYPDISICINSTETPDFKTSIALRKFREYRYLKEEADRVLER